MSGSQSGPPRAGYRRVFTRASIRDAQHSTWVDLPEGPELDTLLDAHLVTTENYRGEGPPAHLPPQRCC